MARYHVRCTICKHRRVFKRRPDQYERQQPRCDSCGNRRWFIDKWMQRRDTRAMGCACLGYNWGGIFHRRGSLHCWYHADGSVRGPSPEELEDLEEQSCLPLD